MYVMDQMKTIEHPKSRRTKSILFAAAILIVGGYILRKVVNGMKIEDPISDDSYDFMM